MTTDKYYQLWLSVVDENTKNANEVRRLRTENERLRDDAKRYRWLRDARDGTDTIYDDDFDLLRGEALDAAIDKVLMEHRNAD